MKNNKLTILIIALLVIFSILLVIKFTEVGYGSDRLCASIGGIWCYAPNWNTVLNFIISILIIIILVLFNIWMIKQRNIEYKRRRR